MNFKLKEFYLEKGRFLKEFKFNIYLFSNSMKNYIILISNEKKKIFYYYLSDVFNLYLMSETQKSELSEILKMFYYCTQR
jgi:hypothetical protein